MIIVQTILQEIPRERRLLERGNFLERVCVHAADCRERILLARVCMYDHHTNHTSGNSGREETPRERKLLERGNFLERVCVHALRCADCRERMLLPRVCMCDHRTNHTFASHKRSREWIQANPRFDKL
jgi:hypothetical protein